MGCDAFCPLRLVTAGSRVKYKEKRREDSISPTFPRLFYSCDTTLRGTAFLPPPGTTIGRQGGEGGGGVCLHEHLSWLSCNTQNGAQGCSSPRRDHSSVLNGNEERVIHPP